MKKFLKNIATLVKLAKTIRLIKNSIKVFFFTINLKNNQTTAPIIKNLNGFILRSVKDAYVTFSFKLKEKKKFQNLSEIKSKSKVGIILQGPISGNINFLLETIKFYKQLFPECLLIISTWNNEKKIIKDKINNAHVKVLYNQLPENLGYGNINAQILSTYNAIEFLKAENCDYILKSRTDCRIYRPNSIEYMINMLKVFKSNHPNQRSRIVACSSNTCKYRIYGITDILLFGETEEIKNYFEKIFYEDGLKLFGKQIEREKLVNFTPVVSEVYLCGKYLINKGEKLEWTLDHYWKCIKDLFIIVDYNSLDFFWKKYDWNFEQKFHKHYSEETNRSLDFLDWLYIYNAKEVKFNKKFQEKWEKSGNDFKKISIF